MRLTKLNGFIYIHDYTNELEWCDSSYNNKGQFYQWFLLNETTKELFLNLFSEESFDSSSKDIFNEIKSFVQNPKNSDDYIEKIMSNQVVPNGITLKEHQTQALSLMYSHNKYALFLGMGTGKTIIAITWLMNVKPKTALIVTPSKVISQYKKELDKYIPNNHYDVTNYESLSKYQSKIYEAIILDESHKAKNYSSQIHENLKNISKYNTKYIYLFTGTPQDKLEDEILAQLSLLDERVMPIKTKTLSRYFNFDNFYKPKSILKHRKNELLKMIGSYCFARQTELVVKNLPEKEDKIIECDKPDQKYFSLMQNGVALLDDEWHCVADNPGVHRLKLRQAANNIFKYVNYDGMTKIVVKPSTKYKPLKQLLNEIPKGIIYYEFTETLFEIENALKKTNHSYVIVNGKISKSKVNKNLDTFKKGEADYLVIQSRSGNAGLDLTNVCDIIFYSMPESSIIFDQCKGRIWRIGQKNKCTYHYLIAKDTIEMKLYKILSKKKSLTDKVYIQLMKEESIWLRKLIKK